MFRKVPSLALLAAITLISLVAAAMAGDRSSIRDTGRNSSGRVDKKPDNDRKTPSRDTDRKFPSRDTDRKPPSRVESKPDAGRSSPSRDTDRRPPVRVETRPDVGRKPPSRVTELPAPSRGASAGAGPRSAPAPQKSNSPDLTVNVRPPVEPVQPVQSVPPVRMPAPDKDSPDKKAKKEARDDDPKDNRADPGFTGRMLIGGGFEVTGVENNGPADAAGLQVGDVINSANGIALRTFNDATRALQNARGVLTLDVTDVNTGAAARRVVRF